MMRLAILGLPGLPQSRPPKSRGRLGMTLIEVLIATALTMVIMLALAQGFKTLSQGVSAGRARLTGSDQLRGISSLLRADLSGMTANTRQVPQSQQAANGYFEYYDGPLSDSTAMLYNYVPTAATPEEKLSASRWSDIDDVLMFTAKAKDGQWFRGRVPLALLKIHQANITGTVIQPSVQDWLTDVSVASEYAEIAWFMRPLNEIGGLNVNSSISPPQLWDTPVIDTVPVVDRTGDGVPDPDGMPDRVALCRRVLLLRPDLDITPKYALTLNQEQLTCRPINPTDVTTFREHMRYAYQRCDLSVRSILDLVNGGFWLKTNSLADLQNPENRFAHYVVPAPSYPLPLATTLPILALSAEDVLTAPTSNFGIMIANALGTFVNIPSVTDGTQLAPIDHGFILAKFFRSKVDADSSGNIISVRPTLEEIVASNVVGFDVRGFDGNVQQLASPGADGIWGLNDLVAEAGAPGTDDLVVGPSDPGYALQVATNSLVPISNGCFVDLCWGRRVLHEVSNASLTPAFPGGVVAFNLLPANDARRSVLSSSLSGFEPLRADFLRSMRRSGRFIPPAPGVFVYQVYQPTFDTFTDAYESDGNRQVSGFSENGLVRYNGAAPIPSPNADQGIDGIDLNDSDGIDNNGNGTVDEPGETNGAVDDELELETRPPFVYKMPAIQVKFRVQDVQAGTLQELSIVHDLTGK
jgi:type II secretory pathway pseudopilin PulG